MATNPLWTRHVLGGDEAVIELGCGISGLVALTLAPLVRKYVATDQEYVRRFFRQNIEENRHTIATTSSLKKGGASKKVRAAVGSTKRGGKETSSNSNIDFIPLDWEVDVPSDATLHNNNDSNGESGFDLLISCDCIYNEALIPSFVRTCADICLLRSDAINKNNDRGEQEDTTTKKNPTIAIIAQQQRSPDVFEVWLKETLKFFRVWRIETFDTLAASSQGSGEETGGSNGLGDGSGYVVHILVLRDDIPATS